PEVTPFDRGWLVAMLEADAGIYIERDSSRSNRRRVAIDFEIANEAVAERLSTLLGTRPPTGRVPKPKAGVDWKRTLFRVRLRGPRAVAILGEHMDYFSPETASKVRSVLAQA